MTYDKWKTADDTPEDREEKEFTELQAVYEDLASAQAEIIHLRADLDLLLKAAKLFVGANFHAAQDWKGMRALQAAIAAAEETMK
jgi:hypothetical protein